MNMEQCCITGEVLPITRMTTIACGSWVDYQYYSKCCMVFKTGKINYGHLDMLGQLTERLKKMLNQLVILVRKTAKQDGMNDHEMLQLVLSKEEKKALYIYQKDSNCLTYQEIDYLMSESIKTLSDNLTDDKALNDKNSGANILLKSRYTKVKPVLGYILYNQKL